MTGCGGQKCDNSDNCVYSRRGETLRPSVTLLTSGESHSAHAPPDFFLNGQTNYKNAAETQHCSPVMWNMSTDLLGGTNKEVRLPVLFSCQPVYSPSRLVTRQRWISLQLCDSSVVAGSSASLWLCSL